MPSFLPTQVFWGWCTRQPAPRSCTSQTPEDSAAQDPKTKLNRENHCIRQDFDRYSYLGKIYLHYSPKPAALRQRVKRKFRFNFGGLQLYRHKARTHSEYRICNSYFL